MFKGKLFVFSVNIGRKVSVPDKIVSVNWTVYLRGVRFLLCSKFAPRCCVCNQVIVPKSDNEESVRIVAMDRSFHPQCYKCEVNIGNKLCGGVKLAARFVETLHNSYWYRKVNATACFSSGLNQSGLSPVHQLVEGKSVTTRYISQGSSYIQ